MLRRVLVLIGVIALYRVGASVPAPGVSHDLAALDSAQGNQINLFNLFSGGPLTQVSLFALGVTPFITASIAMQLLESIIPSLKEAKRQGSAGSKRINSITRVVAVVLGIVQAASSAYSLNSRGLFPDVGMVKVLVFVLSSTAGFLVLLWLAELITRHGIGSGVTVLLLVSILSRVWETSDAFLRVNGAVTFLIVIVSTIALLAILTVVNRAERRVPIVHASATADSKVGHLSYLPFKVLHAGVAPIIFASSLVSLAASLADAMGWTSIYRALSNPSSVVYMTATALLVIAFARLYERTSADPVDMANDLMRDSNFIPGIRPGWSTAHFVEDVSLRLAAIACVVIVPMSLMHSLSQAWFALTFLPLAGTSLLIVNSAILDTLRQGESVRSLYSYEEIGR